MSRWALTVLQERPWTLAAAWKLLSWLRAKKSRMRESTKLVLDDQSKNAPDGDEQTTSDTIDEQTKLTYAEVVVGKDRKGPEK